MLTGKSLEEIKKSNGINYWLASDLSKNLGYSDFSTFRKNVITKAQKNFITISGSTVEEDFIAYDKDFKLTRIAVFFCVQFADDKKKEVQKARGELAYFTEELYINLQRLEKRQELTESEKEMCREASLAGMRSFNFGLFKNNGYRGLYNMDLKKLQNYKGYKPENKSDNIYNYMNPLELSANNYRALLTAQSIKSNDTDLSEEDMYTIANSVGKEIREQIVSYTKINPEDIPLSKVPIKELKKGAKKVITDIKFYWILIIFFIYL